MEEKEEKLANEEPVAEPQERVPAPTQETKAIPQVLIGVKLFGKYDFEGVTVADAGMKRYIDLTPVNVPHSGGKHATRQFDKAKMSIVERLINNMMRTKKWTGKKLKAYKAVEDSFDLLAQKTGKNPIQLFVDALQNAGPREEITRLQYGGISVPKAVDVAPMRRVDLALRNICNGALGTSHGSKKSIAECLADELLLASKNDMNSVSIAKKEEIERVSSSAR
jgi:small subunit ribosomal protein S7